MTKFGPHQLVALAVRLFVVGIGINFLRTSFTLTMWLRPGGDFYGLASEMLFLVIIPLFFAVFLWKFPLFIATKLLGPTEMELSHEALDADAAYALGFVILGFYLLFLTVSDVVYWWSYWVYLQSAIDPFEAALPLSPDQKAAMLSVGVELLMSLALILGAKELTRLVKRIRYGLAD